MRGRVVRDPLDDGLFAEPPECELLDARWTHPVRSPEHGGLGVLRIGDRKPGFAELRGDPRRAGAGGRDAVFREWVPAVHAPGLDLSVHLAGLAEHCAAWWSAGGGIKGGTIYGATDEYGYRVVQDKLTVHDLHANMLHLLGIDHKRLTYRYGGRDMRLTDVHGEIVPEILA